MRCCKPSASRSGNVIVAAVKAPAMPRAWPARAVSEAGTYSHKPGGPTNHVGWGMAEGKAAGRVLEGEVVSIPAQPAQHGPGQSSGPIRFTSNWWCM